MKNIEPAVIDNHVGLTKDIQMFWDKNVNAEYIFGKKVSEHNRGTEKYFLDLENQRYRSHHHLLPWINSMIPGKSVLEIGSGIGLDTYTIAKHGLNVTAIDLTYTGVKTAHDRFKKGKLYGLFAIADAESLPFNDNFYDYVYSFGVLHHAADTEKTLKEVFRVLKRGGEARIMLYNRISINGLVHKITGVPFEDRRVLCPVVRRFTKSEVLALFQPFSNVNIKLDYVFGEGYGIIYKLTPRWLYKVLSFFFGWHIMITATK